MKINYFYFLFFILLSDSASGQFVYQDTVFIKRLKNDSLYHRIFFETNGQSVFYNFVSNFDFTQFDKNSYIRSLKYLKSRGLKLTRQTYGDLPTEWVIVQVYKGKMCLYSPSDYYSHYKLKFTDTTVIDWSGEGPEAMRVSSFTKIDSLHYKINLQSQNFITKTMEITFIDKQKGIAVFHDLISPKSFYASKDRYFIMIDVKKMREIPLIVNSCEESKMGELDFDDIDYQKLLKRKF